MNARRWELLLALTLNGAWIVGVVAGAGILARLAVPGAP